MTITRCMCRGCNSVATVKVGLNRRGGRNAYMCEYHAYHTESYGNENAINYGVIKKHNYTFGVELETSYSSTKARYEICASDFLPTYDSTVDVEYKSPIMHGLNTLAKVTKTWDVLINTRQLKINRECGTHFHVGNADYINYNTIDYIRRFCNSLFTELSNELLNNPEATRELFGRNFNDTGWATPYNEYTSATNHRNFINLEHSNTLEFRICKFNNSTQYMKAAHCCYDMTVAIVNNFIKHFNDENIDSSRYHNKTEYRRHKAQVTAKKLVKIYRKYAGLE